MAIVNLITYQPVKGLWALIAILANIAQLPFRVAYYALPSKRQHPRFTLYQAVATDLLRNAIWHFSSIRTYTPLILQAKTKAEKNLLVAIAPSAKPGVYGGICEDKQIRPAAICGHWYPSPYAASEDQNSKILLHFHGGAFVLGDCRPSESGYAAGLLTKHIGKTLVISYRLASNPDGRFPAALQDATSALHHLLDLGIKRSNIVISGDSAGGNIAIALLRHLASAEASSQALGGALLFSPWVDPASDVKPETSIRSPHRWTDYIPTNFAIWGGFAYCPSDSPVAIDGPWISPRAHPFHTRTPVWIQSSGQELLFEEISEFVEGMKGIEGNDISVHVEEWANHDVLLLGNVTGFDKEANRVAQAAGEWLKSIS